MGAALRSRSTIATSHDSSQRAVQAFKLYREIVKTEITNPAGAVLDLPVSFFRTGENVRNCGCKCLSVFMLEIDTKALCYLSKHFNIA